MEVIDADGHVNDRARVDEIAKYMPKRNQYRQIFPEIDHLHFYYFRSREPGFGNPDANAWIDFMDEAGIGWAVLYPTAGLAVGRLVSVEWAISACQAYNSWLSNRFLSVNPRLRGMALLPIQDAEAAAKELQRSVRELGMAGGMLPSNGEGLTAHLGSKIYWPIYEEAEKLGCALSVHVGCLHRFGMDTFSVYYPVHAIGHPIGVMVQAAAMLCHGIFDRFPKLRVAFLEGGATWVPFLLDRLDRSYSTHLQTDVQGNVLGLTSGKKASEYFKKHASEGRIFVGFDCDDEGLGFAVSRAGPMPFIFGSDYPHESFDAKTCRGEIEELLAREDLGKKDKEAVLGSNAARLYSSAVR